VDKLRVGVIGCGQIAQIMHLPYLRELDDRFEIAALSDISPGLLDAIGDLYGVAHRYRDYQDLLARRDVDVVAVLTHDHYAPVVAAAQAGKHILVEKPLCFTLQQADEMIAAAGRHKVTLMVGYMKRYDQGYLYAQERFQRMKGVRHIVVHDLAGPIEKGAVAPVADIYRLRQFQDVPAATLDAGQKRVDASLAEALGTDDRAAVRAYSTLLGLCSHDIAVLRGTFGLPASVLYTRIFDGGRHLVSMMGYGQDEAVCTLEMGGFDLNYTWWDEYMTAYGADEAVTVRFPNPYVRNAPTTVHIQEMDGGRPTEKVVTPGIDEPFRAEWQHFYDCVVNGRQPITDAHGAREDIALLRDVARAGLASSASTDGTGER
jgi:predicted dehydrogenase